MKSRLSFLNKCFVCAITCSVFAASGFADTTVRWKTPNVSGTKSSAPSVVNTAAFSEAKTPAVRSESSPIQQVRYQVRGTTPMPDGSVPSDTAIIDTVYPESRPQTPSSLQRPSVTLPSPGDPMMNLGPGFSGNTDLGDDTSDVVSSRLSDVRQGRVVVKCPEDGIFKPLTDISYDIRIKPGELLPDECLLGDEVYEQRDWQRVCFLWKASALCHKPLYFEEEALERYGHTHVREELQPLVSGAKFFLTIPILPYKMGINPPHECIYTLGYYRPGDCAPYMFDPLPLSLRAGLIEAGVIVGGVAIFP